MPANVKTQILLSLLTLGLVLPAVASTSSGAHIRVEPEIAMAAALAMPMRGRGRATHPHSVLLAAPSPAELEQIEPPRKGKPPQIGFARPVTALEGGIEGTLRWEIVDGDQVAAIALTSPGAAALRFGLDVHEVPAKATFRFHDDAGEVLFEVAGEEILATVAANHAAGERGVEARTWWSPVIESATAVLEVELPRGATPRDLRIAVPRVSHLVASAKTDFVSKAAQYCHNDATCQLGTWSAQMNAISRMLFTSGGGTYVCTGTLLADTDPATTNPYFLTANHCIGSQAVASSLVNYWFYRSSSCNGGSAGPYVQQSAGSGTQLLYNNTATDVAFLRLGNVPPAGTTYAGWKASALAGGNTITALHQPAGDLLKISNGSVSDFLTCSPPDSNGQFSCNTSSAGSSRFYAVSWSSGVTEGGSSGSALFDSGKYVVGQLYGGGSSCSTPGKSDIYGRFDVSYASGNLAQYLSPAPPPPVQRQLTVTKAGTSSTGTVTSAPGGLSCGGTCTASYAEGTVVMLTAAAVPGVSTFAGWAGACTGEGNPSGSTCTVEMNAAANVTAVFNQDNGVAVSPSQLVFGSTQATLPVTFTNTTGARVTFAQATMTSARFGQTNNCGVVAAGASCTAMVTYYPTNAGADSGTLTLTSDSFAGSHGVALFAGNADAPRLSNLSTRMQALSGSDVMIGGFVVGGTAPKTLVVRARGPSLAQFGIYNNLTNPQLQLFSGANQIGYNNDWGQAANVAALISSGFAPSMAQEAAILVTLAPGAYTAIVSGVGGGTGVAIVEVFEVDQPQSPLANISTRGQVRTGSDAMIGGFIISGSSPRTVVVRARGPSLTAAGVPGALPDPLLQLFRSSDGVAVAANDNWATAANSGQLSASGFAPSNAMEAAILVTLPPGAYTAVISGANGSTGVGIVEVFAQ